MEKGQCRIVEYGKIKTSEGLVILGAIIEFPSGPPDGLTFGDVWDRRAFTLERVPTESKVD